MSTESRLPFQVDPAEVSGSMMDILLSDEATKRLSQEANDEILAIE